MKVYIRTTRIDGKPQPKRELIVDGVTVAELTPYELLEFLAHVALSLKED